MRYLLILIVLISLAASAAVYMETDQNGNTLYSDTPVSQDSKPIENNNTTSTISTPNPSVSVGTTTTPTEPPLTPVVTERKPYTTFEITNPKGTKEIPATIHNEPKISVSLSIDPALQQGDRIQLYLDGAPFGKAASSTSFTMDNVDRGVHELSAAIIDQNNQVIKNSQSIPIVVLRQTLNSPNRQSATP